MHTRALRQLLVGLTFGVTFVINPAYLTGCGAEGEEGPSLAEREAYIVEELDTFHGQGALEFEHGGESYELMFALERRTGDDDATSAQTTRFVSTAHACGTHTFFQSASACSTQYNLAVEGTVMLRRLGAEPEVVAELPITGTFGYGLAFFTLGEEQNIQLQGGEDGYVVYSFVAHDLGDEGLDIEYLRP